MSSDTAFPSSRDSDREGERRIIVTEKNCILFLPYPLEKSGNRARQLRPRKMLEAFRETGFRVFVIHGYSAQRKRKIRKLKQLMERGIHFDFMYAECSTEPMRLTDPHHLPDHPFLDFGLFRYLKEKGVPIGLFYCDIYWKFPVYREALSMLKYCFALREYRRDLKQYEKYLSRFYVPDMKMCEYLDREKITAMAEALPPGADRIEVPERTDRGRDFHAKPLQIFYVGGILNHYRIDTLLSAAQELEDVCVTICCREEEWKSRKESLAPLLTDRVEIIHKNEDELVPYYERADIGSLLFENGEYWGLAQPVKAYEYLAHELPVLVTEDTAVGRFVESVDYGWSIPCEKEAVIRLLSDIMKNPELLEQKRAAARERKSGHLWSARAEQVASGLMGGRNE